MKYSILVLLLLVPALTTAEEREEKIRKIMDAQGLIQTFEQQLEFAKKQNMEQGQAMLNQVMAQLKPTPEYKKKFDKAFQEFITEASFPWGAKEIVEVWSKFYGEQFTNSELDQLLAHYSSPLAQKEITATRQAMVKFSSYFAEAGKPIAEKATSNFISNLKLVAKECNCKR
jgi:hypothetical protein